MSRCSPRVNGDAEAVWLSSKRKEVAHLIPPVDFAIEYGSKNVDRQLCHWRKPHRHISWGVSSKWSVITALQAVDVGSSPAIPTKPMALATHWVTSACIR